MSIKEFAEAVRKELETRTGKKVEVREVLKNNGVILHGISIFEENTNITPTIYLENFFNDFENGKELEEIVESVLVIHKRDKPSNVFSVDWFRDLEKVKKKIAYKLVNYERNKELLEQIPYEQVMDLAKVYYVSVDTKELGHGTILIHNTHLDLWGITAEQLGEIAEENTPKLFPTKTIWLGEMLNDPDVVGTDTVRKQQDLLKIYYPMYVMSNAENVFGAATLCYPDALRLFAEEMKKDILIIPSSTHEIIMVPMFADTNIMHMKGIVHEVNRTAVREDEILSDSVYIYDRESDSITIA